MNTREYEPPGARPMPDKHWSAVQLVQWVRRDRSRRRIVMGLWELTQPPLPGMEYTSGDALADKVSGEHGHTVANLTTAGLITRFDRGVMVDLHLTERGLTVANIMANAPRQGGA